MRHNYKVELPLRESRLLVQVNGLIASHTRLHIICWCRERCEKEVVVAWSMSTHGRYVHMVGMCACGGGLPSFGQMNSSWLCLNSCSSFSFSKSEFHFFSDFWSNFVFVIFDLLLWLSCRLDFGVFWDPQNLIKLWFEAKHLSLKFQFPKLPFWNLLWWISWRSLS